MASVEERVKQIIVEQLGDFRFRFWLLRLPFRASDSPPILCTAPSKVNRGG